MCACACVCSRDMFRWRLSITFAQCIVNLCTLCIVCKVNLCTQCIVNLHTLSQATYQDAPITRPPVIGSVASLTCTTCTGGDMRQPSCVHRLCRSYVLRRPGQLLLDENRSLVRSHSVLENAVFCAPDLQAWWLQRVACDLDLGAPVATHDRGFLDSQRPTHAAAYSTSIASHGAQALHLRLSQTCS